MSEQQTICRRCSVCEGASHHWLDNPDFGEDQPDEEGGNVEATHVCKHCDALGMECEACDGSGYVGYSPAYVSFGEIVGPDAENCQKCNGEGVILFNPAEWA
jgi:hypothetical protein